MIKTDSPRVEELPLIYDSWIRSFRNSPYAGCVVNDIWYETMKHTLDAVLPKARVIVALPGDDAIRRVIGYVVVEKPNIIHYIYVKQKFRGLGVAAQLLEAATAALEASSGYYTFRTPASKWLESRGWKHNPTPARLA